MDTNKVTSCSNDLQPLSAPACEEQPKPARRKKTAIGSVINTQLLSSMLETETQGSEAVIQELAKAIDPTGQAEKLAALIKPMPEKEQRIVLYALSAGASLESLTAALEQLTTAADAKLMAAFLERLELQTALKKSKKRGSKYTAPKKKRRKK